MRRLLCAVLLLAACGDPPPPTPVPAPAAPGAAEVSEVSDEDFVPSERPKPPPRPTGPVDGPTESPSPSAVLGAYLDALRASDAAAARGYALVPDDSRAAADDLLDERAEQLASGALLVDVIETRVQGVWALSVVKVTNTTPVRVRQSIESRLMKRDGGVWLVVPVGLLVDTADDADHSDLLDWFEGTRADFEAKHLKER